MGIGVGTTDPGGGVSRCVAKEKMKDTKVMIQSKALIVSFS